MNTQELLLFSKNKSLNFDDVNLLSNNIQVVSSRSEISFERSKLLVAPMHAIQSVEFCHAAAKSGITVCINRFCPKEEQLAMMLACIDASGDKKTNKHYVSVGLKDYKECIDFFIGELGTKQINVLLDVANGYSSAVADIIVEISKRYPDVVLMTGNVHTKNGYGFLSSRSDGLIRVGIANGSACDTKGATGIARGQLTSVLECSDYFKFIKYARGKSNDVISDGGIKKPADVAKAFGAGAGYVMIGRMFADARESLSSKTGMYYGGASAYQKQLTKSEIKNVEGKLLTVDSHNLSIESIVSSIEDGVRSAISYSGYSSLDSFIGNAEFEIA